MGYVLIKCEPHIVTFFFVVVHNLAGFLTPKNRTNRDNSISKSHSPLSLPLAKHSPRCSYWSRDLRSGGDPGCPGQRLLFLSVPFLTAPPASARPLVLPANVSFPLLFLLQELCLHHGALLVWLLLWFLCTGTA